MIKKSYEYTIKITSVSIDSDYKPFREKMMQKSTLRIPDMVSRKYANMTPDFDVDRTIQYFQEQSNRLALPHNLTPDSDVNRVIQHFREQSNRLALSHSLKP